ncbi:putative equilibrative nucleoside transporter [Helianthus anomalus]
MEVSLAATASASRSSEIPTKVEGKYKAMLVCWILGIGCLFSWNSMLTIEDYYINLFPKYHPSRVLTLVYQPTAFITLVILTYYEAKVDTRKRNLLGYVLFFFSTLAVLVVSSHHSAFNNPYECHPLLYDICGLIILLYNRIHD